MDFYLIGIDHKKAPLDLLERAWHDREAIRRSLGGGPGGHAAVLATCNRVEIYGTGQGKAQIDRRIREIAVEYGYFFEHGTMLHGEHEVFEHAIRLAAGLESQIKGEAQILRQIERWRAEESFPNVLATLWDEAIREARFIRSVSGLDANMRTIAQVVYDDIIGRESDKDRIAVIVIGTGKVAGLFALHRPGRVELYFAAHKNRAQARFLAGMTGGSVISISDIPDLVADADALIGASSSPHVVVRGSDLEKASQRARPLYVYDLAVPRDIEEGARDIRGVILKNVIDMAPLCESQDVHMAHSLESADHLISNVMRDREKVLYAY